MKNWSMKDKRWGEMKIGNTQLKLKDYGCLVVSLSMLADRFPDNVLDILNRNNCFDKNGLLISDLAAKILGLEYLGKGFTLPDHPCIAETNHFAPKIPQHFFVWLGDSKIIDPLDGKEKINPYHIISFRLFKRKNKPAEKKSLIPITVSKLPNLKERVNQLLGWFFHD